MQLSSLTARLSTWFNTPWRIKINNFFFQAYILSVGFPGSGRFEHTHSRAETDARYTGGRGRCIMYAAAFLVRTANACLIDRSIAIRRHQS